MEQIEYDIARDAWVVYTNSTSDAQEVKRLHPEDTVLLFDRDKGTYTRYMIKVKTRKPIIHAGKLVYEDGETIEV